MMSSYSKYLSMLDAQIITTTKNTRVLLVVIFIYFSALSICLLSVILTYLPFSFASTINTKQQHNIHTTTSKIERKKDEPT